MLIFKIIPNKNLYTWSSNKKKIEATAAKANTIKEPTRTSFFVGHVTLKASCLTLWRNLNGFIIFIAHFNHFLAGAEGIEPPTSGFGDRRSTNWATLLVAYLIIFVTTPAPTVLPPSLIAKFSFSFIAIGVINLTLNLASSPGITISVPEGSVTSPVTSVVLK